MPLRGNLEWYCRSRKWGRNKNKIKRLQLDKAHVMQALISRLYSLFICEWLVVVRLGVMRVDSETAHALLPNPPAYVITPSPNPFFFALDVYLTRRSPPAAGGGKQIRSVFEAF